MKKFINTKKTLAMIMATTIALSVASCGGTSTQTTEDTGADSSETTTSSQDEIEKPEKITAFIDTIFGSDVEPTSWSAWEDKYKEMTGIDIEFTKPVHNEYYQQLSLAFTTGDIPDAMELGSLYYPTYANNGALWDMTDAWESSELKASGILDEQFVEALRLQDGRIYGFPETRGNGTVTYIRQDWLDNLGLEMPTTYDEFIAVLEAFTHDDPDGNGIDDTYGVTMPGLVSPEAPYTMYTREFYQDAEPGIYQKDDGTWVDGMQEPQMIDALQRFQDAYMGGLIDQEVVTNKTSTCRDKFYDGQVGVFNYWAGNWNINLQSNLSARDENGIVAPMPAIAETHYVERPPTAFAISSSAENPEGIFKYLIELSHDGGEGQLLFTRGVEGVNYEINDGVYTQLPDQEDPTKPYEKAWFAPELSITEWDDPIEMDDAMTNSLEIFAEHSEIAPVPVVNDVVSEKQANVMTVRDQVIALVTTGQMTPEDGIAMYNEQAGADVDAILTSLNE